MNRQTKLDTLRGVRLVLLSAMLVLMVGACDPFAVDETSSGLDSCLTANDCGGAEICVSPRICTVSQISGSCDCNTASTDGECLDFTGSSAPNPNTCTLSGGSCALAANCCQGLSCNNGTCEGASGSCPFSL